MRPESYSHWKKWNSKNFGLVSRQENQYYNLEVKKRLYKKTFPSVCEIGFGNGTFLKYCKNQKWLAEGFEANRNLVKVAKSKGFLAYDTKEFFTKKTKYDIIVAFDVIEHIGEKDILKIFREFKTRLKINGLLILRFPNGDSPLGLFHQNGDLTHKCSFGAGKIICLATQNQLTLNYLGPQANVFCLFPFLGFLQKVIKQIVKKIGNLIFRAIFSPQSQHFYYLEPNLVCVLQKVKNCRNEK